MERPDKDTYYLNIAKAVCIRSTCLKRQYGAVIVNNNEIISTGYNGAPRGEISCYDLGICDRLEVPHNSGDYSKCRAVHAEMNAIISAARSEMLGGTLYLYGMDNNISVEDACPCPVCYKMIKNAGIKKVVTISKEDFL